jgi:4-hydroxyphenylpyruvate dioxygenase
LAQETTSKRKDTPNNHAYRRRDDRNLRLNALETHLEDLMQTAAVTPDSLWDNPMETDGFEFVEFAAKDAAPLHKLMTTLGFAPVAKHRTKSATLYRQGTINFIVTEEASGHAADFTGVHGPCACSMGFRVTDADVAHRKLIELGATSGPDSTTRIFSVPTIEGIGGSLIYLVDHKSGSLYDADFEPIPGADQNPIGFGLGVIDHLTHNVQMGRMDHWAGFYEKLFNFRQIRFFDIEGQHTGLKSRAMTGPCGKLRIPINESSDDKSQIAEYLEIYKGEGIQHIALSTPDIFKTVDALRTAGMDFMTPPPDSYYDMLDERLPGHGQPVDEMKSRAILLDGADNRHLLLQIFTETEIGPIFFEIISRKGDDGFGEGNFKALFESMERDQIRRGVLNVD